MPDWLKRLFCFHRSVTFERNIYGDEILAHGMKRSQWRCNACGARVFKDKLHVDNCGND